MNGVRSLVRVSVPLMVEIVRHARRRCEACGRRRVLYTIGVDPDSTAGPMSESQAFCAPCWGVR